MKFKDQKLLELLYESVANKNVLLDEEKRVIEKLANNITDAIYNNIDTSTRFYGVERLDRIVHSKYMDDINYGRAFKNITDEQRYALSVVFEKSILTVLYCYLVTIEGRDVPEKVCFYTFDDWLHKNEGNQIIVPFENDKQVFEMLKKIITQSVFDIYNSYSAPGGMFHNETVKIWYEWRKEELKRKEIADRLPELGGIF